MSFLAPGLATIAILGAIPARLREQLLGAFNEVLRNYRERRWEPSELNGGKLCEVVYSILRGHVDGKFPPTAKKPANMLDACKAFEQVDAAVFPRAVRVQIPRMLVALYEIRNNRGVGHVGGDVDPNLMDATAVLAMSKWVMAELVRLFHAVSVDDAQVMVEALSERILPLIWRVGDLRRVLDPGMPAADKTLLLLYHSGGWVTEADLRAWVEYANSSNFTRILNQAHRQKLIEYDRNSRRALLSPLGIKEVETRIHAGPT
jgi:hypothetical protein